MAIEMRDESRLSTKKLGGLGACSPREIFKIRRSEITSEAMFGQNATRTSPLVVPIARRMNRAARIKPPRTTRMLAPPQVRSLDSLVATLDALYLVMRLL